MTAMRTFADILHLDPAHKRFFVLCAREAENERFFCSSDVLHGLNDLWRRWRAGTDLLLLHAVGCFSHKLLLLLLVCLSRC